MEDKTGFDIRDQEYQNDKKKFTENYEKNKTDHINAQKSKLLNVKSNTELKEHLDNIAKNYDAKYKAVLDKQISSSEQFHFKDTGGSRKNALQRTQAYEKQLKGEVPKLKKEFGKEKGMIETEKDFDQRMLERQRAKRNHDRSHGGRDV